jgi:hypothetical protein
LWRNLASLLGRFLGILRSFLAQTCPAEGVEGMTKPEPNADGQCQPSASLSTAYYFI